MNNLFGDQQRVNKNFFHTFINKNSKYVSQFATNHNTQQHQKEKNANSSIKTQLTPFSETNPFYHLQMALQKQSSKEEQSQKCKFFRNMTVQIGQMNKICQKLMKSNNEIDQNQQHRNTFIMDLINLQSKRQTIDETSTETVIKSCVSISDHIESSQNHHIDIGYSQKQQFSDKNSDDINFILLNTAQKIELLENTYDELQKQLNYETLLEEQASKQNLFLRSQIAKLDCLKCNEIEKLTKQLEWQRKNIYAQQKKKSSYIAKVQEVSNIAQEQSLQSTVSKLPKRQAQDKENQRKNTSYEQKVSPSLPKSDIKRRNLVYL